MIAQLCQVHAICVQVDLMKDGLVKVLSRAEGNPKGTESSSTMHGDAPGQLRDRLPKRVISANEHSLVM